MSFLSSRLPLMRQIAAKRISGNSISIRFASTKPSSTEMANKASETLAKAGSTLVKVGTAASEALGQIGGRTGKVISLVQSIIPRATYYSRVGLEIGKLVAENRKMSPPSVANFQVYFQELVNGFRNPSSPVSPTSILSRIRNVNKQQLAVAGVAAAEILGFFTVGEIVGRMKLVGYRSSEHGAHH